MVAIMPVFAAVTKETSKEPLNKLCARQGDTPKPCPRYKLVCIDGLAYLAAEHLDRGQS